jgi:cytochrome c553
MRAGMKTAFWVGGLVSTLVTGCYLGTDNAGQEGAQSGSPEPGATSASGSSGSGAIDAKASGLPCDVVLLLEKYCTGCHGNPPSGGAPESLVSYADLTAASKTVPGQSVAEVSLARIQNGTMPPKPAQGPSASETAALQAWIAAGTHQDGCAIAIDAGSGAPNPYDTPLQCSSKSYWRGGDDGSSRMHPGGACIDCHDRSGGEAPFFSIAGTVYPTAHEPNDCNGTAASGTLKVTITGADGASFDLYPNSVGNFYGDNAVKLPYSAKVVSSTGERSMSAAQTSGDCNGCHTPSGANSAPGRIMAP